MTRECPGDLAGPRDITLGLLDLCAHQLGDFARLGVAA